MAASADVRRPLPRRAPTKVSARARRAARDLERRRHLERRVEHLDRRLKLGLASWRPHATAHDISEIAAEERRCRLAVVSPQR